MTRGGALSLQGLIGSLRDHTCTAAMQDNCDTSLMQLLQTHQLQNHNAHATRHQTAELLTPTVQAQSQAPMTTGGALIL